MEIPKQYKPSEVEDKWYQHWINFGFFKSVPDGREPFTVVIPPPNVTGVLHMGHMLNNTIQDVLIRRARMQGKNACWVPGTDHASIATEAKVVNKLKEEGIQKSSLSREDFLKHAWAWKEKHGGIILDQLKKLGASCDWERTKFTMDPDMSQAVIDVFIDLHRKGLIYRGVRMINWDPAAKTALSDEEVNYRETPSKLHYIKYTAADGSFFIPVATTRPETILGDTAVCVNPSDSRYSKYIGSTVLVPIINRKVPVIADDYVEIEFGTGALKITPAHDINDYNIGIKFRLEAIDVIADDGRMAENTGKYAGIDRFIARKQIVNELDRAGLLIKTEDIINKVGYSERTNAVIEPKLSRQWFLQMEKLAKPALDAVLSGKVQLHPAKFVNTYRHWMENVKDWCISRQLWWGQQIPAWYNQSGDYVVAASAEEAVIQFAQDGKQVNISDIKQDPDVLDTWFSSWLWPISVFDPEAFRKERKDWNRDLSYYYPTNDLITAPEILFFWVARMIMAGIEYCGEVPFSNVYLTGIVRDKQGRKMSKSLGNSPDPIELISKYGADGVRLGMLLTSPAGNDLPFDESLCEQGRNFNNKIWNAFRLIKGWEVSETQQPQSSVLVIQWFDSRLQEESERIASLFEKYRISEALMGLYKLVWDDFCSWYLEAIKPSQGHAVDYKTHAASLEFFEAILKLLHPFTPFVSEEIWHFLRPRENSECLIVEQLPASEKYDQAILDRFNQARELISAIRTFRNDNGISPKEKLVLIQKQIIPENLSFEPVIIKLANLERIERVSEKPSDCISLMVKTGEFFVYTSENIDLEAEREKVLRELDYTKGFLISVQKKLENERFIAGAKPEIVELEKRKQTDALVRIKILEKQLQNLN